MHFLQAQLDSRKIVWKKNKQQIWQDKASLDVVKDEICTCRIIWSMRSFHSITSLLIITRRHNNKRDNFTSISSLNNTRFTSCGGVGGGDETSTSVPGSISAASVALVVSFDNSVCCLNVWEIYLITINKTQQK